MAVALTACNGGGTSTPDDGWTPLAPGGSVEGPGGSRLIAPAGTIEETQHVRVSTGMVPAGELQAEALSGVGQAVAVQAQNRAAALGQARFIVELPLPVGVDPAAAGVAVFLDGSETAGHVDLGQPLEAPLLEVVEADVDPAAGVVRVDLSLLGEAPSVIQVVDGAAFVEVAPLTAQSHGDGFVYMCRRKDSDICDDHALDVHADIAEAHQRFAGMGFAQPRLRTNSEGRYKIHLKPFVLSDNRKTCHVDEDGDGRFTARYNFLLSKITLCVGGGEIDDDGWTVARGDNAAHEMFHAVQYGYGRVRARPMQMWSVESTANLSETSTDTDLIRTNSAMRPVDVPLDLNFIGNPRQSDSNQYRAQDFFAFLGEVLAPGQGLAYLTEVFEEGVTPPRVSNAIGTFGNVAIQDLSDAYWAWARNQTFEKTVRTRTNGADPHPDGNACELLADVADPELIFMTDGSTPISQQATLPPLTTAVIELNVNAGAAFAEEILFQTFLHGSGLRAALYDPADCLNPDLDPVAGSFTVPAGTTGTRYVLVSNTEFRQGRSRSFTFEASYGAIEPGVRITEPAPGTTIDETERTPLRAEGVDGVLPGDALLRWSYLRADGVLFIIGDARADQAIGTPRLCDGTYPVTVEVLDGPAPFVDATDTVDLTVVDGEPPPERCEPTVAIVTPDDGATFPSGESIAFEAAIDDADLSTDDPVHPIVWRRDGPGSPVLAQDTLSFETDALLPGVYDIFVTYGSAKDSISVEVLDTDREAPRVLIAQPEDGASFVYSDFEYGGRYIDLPAAGLGLDANEDPPQAFSDAAHEWSFRRAGTTAWSEGPTGTEVTLQLDFDGPKDTWEIRLQVTDGFGLTGEDRHTITMTNPAQ
ncbi:MAG: hypothetical protein U5K81_10120 [Trueperaceae bacterium]|nr:hypothetical protein [Trueperaceae bacterium]